MDELPNDTRRFLTELASANEPTDDERQRVRVALGSKLATLGLLGTSSSSLAPGAAEALGSGAAPSIAAPGAAVATSVSLPLKALGGAALVALGLSGVWLATSGEVQPSPVLQTSASAALAQIARSASAVEVPPQVAPEVVVESPAPVAPLPPRRSAPTAPAKPDLSEELRLIRGAHTALRGGATGEASKLLDEHARRFPKGAMASEREITRVLVLCEQNPSAGRARAAAMIAAQPDSAHARRIRSQCGIEQ